MSVKLAVQTHHRTGLAFTCVPSNVMWELVEYLAVNRTQVFYSYSHDGFIVTFQRLGRVAAQELLDAWTHSWITGSSYQDPALEDARELVHLSR
jgi:hypothetical protein